jgi:putative membrane protein
MQRRARSIQARAGAAAAAALIALTLAAGCGSEKRGDQPGETGAVQAPSPKPTASSSAGGHAGTPSAAAAAARVSSQDRSWLNEAHQSDIAEIQAGESAAKGRATSAAVRSAGAMLARDHTALDHKIIAAASALRITLPDFPAHDAAEAADRLAKETGSRYDHDFTSTMLISHQKMISGTQAEISHGSSPEITALARQALPVLRNHLAALQAAAAAP